MNVKIKTAIIAKICWVEIEKFEMLKRILDELIKGKTSPINFAIAIFTAARVPV